MLFKVNQTIFDQSQYTIFKSKTQVIFQNYSEKDILILLHEYDY